MKEIKIFDKIYGAWVGKIAGGTFGMPVEGKDSNIITILHPPLSEWSKHHRSNKKRKENYDASSYS